MNDSILSDHVRMSVPVEREWLGRDSISELERIWRFMNAATDGNLPRWVLVVIDWDRTSTVTDYRNATVRVGMSQRGAGQDLKAFLLRRAADAMARLGLSGLSQRAVEREENRFLLAGMAEILVHEYDRNSRSLACAWVISQMLDRMRLLGLSEQSSWSAFSEGRQDLRASSPGITFLITCRQLHGRDRILKLFEALRKGTLQQSLSLTFKTTSVELEREWLKRVRDYQPQDITVTSPNDAPRLVKAVQAPEVARAGGAADLRLYISDGSDDLLASGIFLQDEVSGRVMQARPESENGDDYLAVAIPIEAGRKPGVYNYRLTAVDESGNVRTWSGKYSVS